MDRLVFRDRRGRFVSYSDIWQGPRLNYISLMSLAINANKHRVEEILRKGNPLFEILKARSERKGE